MGVDFLKNTYMPLGCLQGGRATSVASETRMHPQSGIHRDFEPISNRNAESAGYRGKGLSARNRPSGIQRGQRDTEGKSVTSSAGSPSTVLLYCLP